MQTLNSRIKKISSFTLMMIFNISVFLLCLLSFFKINAQGINNDLLNYNLLINKAEKKYMEGDSKSALLTYKKAFRIIDGFTIDRCNALKLATKLEEKSIKNDCLAFFHKNGACKEFFEQFNGMKIQKFNRKTPPTVNQKVLKIVDSLFTIDQNVRKDRSNPSKIREADSSNFECFKSIISKFGFPSEKTIGVVCSGDKKKILVIDFRRHSLLLHFSQARFDGIQDILFKALTNGSLKPIEYAHYFSFIDNTIYVTEPVAVIDDKKYMILSEESLEKINKSRAEIGLFSVQDHIERILFKENNPNEEFIMLLFPGVMNFMNAPVQLKEELKKKFVEIKKQP